GFSLWFGITGSADLASLAKVIWNPESPIYTVRNQNALAALTTAFALLFIFLGFAYKMSTIPMHFWAPDVYDGAPTAITAYLSGVSKAAGFAITLRFLEGLAGSINALPTDNPAASLWTQVDW